MTNTYGDAFFEGHTTRPGYAYIAKFLYAMARPKSAIDFGCGVGATLKHLQNAGVEIVGLDGNETKHAYIDVQIRDLGQKVDLGRTFDLVISAEVAEHLPEAHAKEFVGNMVRHAHGLIFFTAAHPGQGGVAHINEQPKEYWAAIFRSHGYRRAWACELLGRFGLFPVSGMPWIPQNYQIFSAKRPPSLRALLLIPKFAVLAVLWRFSVSRFGVHGKNLET